MGKFLTLLFSVLFFSACGNVALSPAAGPIEHSQILTLKGTGADDSFCPTGSWYSATEKLCVTEREAVGPFTRKMIALCKKYGGGDTACEGNRWSRGFAARLRSSATCPEGAQFDSDRKACVEGQEVFGPFRRSDVERCRKAGGGATCDTMRWSIAFLPKLNQAGSANRQLYSYYSVRSNYDDVFTEVLSFYPAGRRNGCVAFMSTALRRSGTPVPQSAMMNGESVSLVTLPFSRYLQEKLGWLKITNAQQLQPGDVVLTEDDARYPGYPAHTYMFYGWSDQRSGIGWVIDNQDFVHERNVFGYGTYNFTPFAYALRSPQ
ncbi:MAG: hypothetical protein RIR26_2085 [Pseudomonadota bacterium]|jgi:hypothetical protein